MKKMIVVSCMIASVLFSAEHIIDQKGKTFIPHAINVRIGDTIVFKNSDPFAHNAYTDHEENEFDIGMQAPGQDASAKVLASGAFNVECAIHPNMLLEVTAK